MPKSPSKLLLIALTFLLAACLDRSDEPIRIGINPWPGYEPLFLAHTQGFFEEEGVTVELVEFSSLGDVRRAFERGQVDGMASSLIEVIQANERSAREPRVFLIVDFSAGADVLVVDQSIKTLQDLKGKRIAAEAASLSMFIVAQRQGIGRADFEASLEDIQFFSAASQRAYFGPNGILRRVIARHEEVLRKTGQIAGNKDATRPIAEPGPQVVQGG